ncbi:hypothetical protein EYB26_000182 [Talaromyces marneffei]|uniref:uncharacterized protein n=1 Tax=Talaromyces marneffei TaxID=37727 RepID=UPI0012A84ACA|nr:uncharacterized protein EYB26_000182 [Talaromyces marneffei]QGA12538.1 hypothetical protein EYB26_000182 [Talaromyces marneffei]
MPCFKGLAVSIHTPDGPIPEFSVQRQSRQSRIACYIPVPAPKITESGKAQASTFAVSITLLNAGQSVPYSTPKPTPENPNPKPQLVGVSEIDEKGQTHWINPYLPLTGSVNETVAAYIYFDGRQKEEVATLLRRGEETWVNSRWVSVPDSEGGGLAEREFLFREVGLERWLNGLDLEGKDAAAKIERRRQKMEKRRLLKAQESGDMDMDAESSAKRDKGIMRYGADAKAPLENLSDEEFSSDSDDDPIPESAGQIKVALFRVLASGEIRRGEYSPQFDAHDDDEEGGQGGDGTADVDHTTSFAKPKSLDPTTISTQTVTGIDPTDKPYAVFTFMYRGERQLQKMGILKSKPAEETPSRRKSTDFSKLAPLKPGGAVGFMGYREGDNVSSPKAGKKSKKSSESDMDSDDDVDDKDPVIDKADDDENNDTTHLSPDDLRRQGDLAEGVRKIKLKRQHSMDPMGDSTSNANTPASAATPPAAATESSTPPHASASAPAPADANVNDLPNNLPDNLNSAEYVGSPLKKARASVSTADEDGLRKRLGSNLANNISELLGGEKTETPTASGTTFGGTGSHFGGNINTKVSPAQPTNAQQAPQDDDEEL